MAEDKKPEKSAAERRYAKGGEKKPEAKPAPKAPEAGNREEEHEGASPRADMIKRHMKEARDLHGSHRDEMKKMHSRHEEEMSQMQGAEPAAAPQEPAEPAAEEG